MEQVRFAAEMQLRSEEVHPAACSFMCQLPAFCIALYCGVQGVVNEWHSWAALGQLGMKLEDGWCIKEVPRLDGPLSLRGFVDKHYKSPDGTVCLSVNEVLKYIRK